MYVNILLMMVHIGITNACRVVQLNVVECVSIWRKNNIKPHAVASLV